MGEIITRLELSLICLRVTEEDVLNHIRRKRLFNLWPMLF